MEFKSDLSTSTKSFDRPVTYSGIEETAAAEVVEEFYTCKQKNSLHHLHRSSSDCLHIQVMRLKEEESHLDEDIREGRIMTSEACRKILSRLLGVVEDEDDVDDSRDVLFSKRMSAFTAIRAASPLSRRRVCGGCN